MNRAGVSFSCKAVLAGSLFMSAVFSFSGLGWGLPSAKTLETLAPDQASRSAFVARLAESRPTPGDGNWIAFNIARRAEEAESRRTGVLDGPLESRVARSFLLASGSFEEALVLAAVSSLDPMSGDLDPGVLQYGGAHLYAVAAALKGAQLAGYACLVPDVRFYLERPGEMARLYRVGRMVSAVCGVLVVLATFHLAVALAGGGAGALAALLVALSPILVAHAHMMRSHLFALPWALWALVRIVRLREDPGWRKSLAAGALAGLAAGSVLYHAALLLPFLVAHGHGPHWKEKGRQVAAGLAAFAAVFVITNPSLVFSGGLLAMEWADHGLDHAGNRVFGFDPAAAVRLFLGILPQAMGPAGFLAACAGAFAVAWRPAHWVVLAAFVPALGGMLLRRGHTPEDFAYARFGLILVPLGAVWAAVWAVDIARNARRASVLVGTGAVLFQLPLCLAYVGNFREAAGPVSTAVRAAREIAEHVPEGAAIAFDAIPNPADTPVVDPGRFDVRFAPGALDAPDVRYWVVSETCPHAWRTRIERDFEPWITVEKSAPFLPALPFRDRFAMANRDFTIYKRRQESGERSQEKD